MTISKEFKIGAVFIVTIAILFFGLNFLKGIDIFTPTNRYYAVYEDIGGLVVSNSVNIKGYKVGQVRHIAYNFSEETPFVVEITINKDIKLPNGTKFVLKDDGLIGGKMIEIAVGNAAGFLASGDTVPSIVADNIMDDLEEYMPKILGIVDSFDTIAKSLNSLISDPSLKAGVQTIAPTMENLNLTMAQIRQATATLPATINKIDGIAASVETKIGEFDMKAMNDRLQATLTSFDDFTQKLNNDNSSLGLFLKDRSLYDNLNSTIQSADSLMIDLKANPKRYVHFSVFGRKN